MSLLAELSGSIGSVGYGLAAIGPGVGIGIIFGQGVQARGLVLQGPLHHPRAGAAVG